MKLPNFYYLLFLLFLIVGCTSEISDKDDMNLEENNAMEDIDSGVKDFASNEKVQMKEEINIAIEDFEYKPNEIRIKKGVTVIWTQKDSVKHTVTSDDNIFDSGLLSEGDTWSYKFNEEGVYSYYCILHPNMKGRVVVE